MATNPHGGLFVDEQGKPLPWDEDLYKETIGSLDEEMQALIVGFDHIGSYRQQIAKAQELAMHRSDFAFTILLKAQQGNFFHNFDALSPIEVSNLRAFDVIGVTEKELGETILGRLRTLARFRTQLDDADVSSPIHVFGGLDPLYTPLLFAAGAELFDGLGWLRYSYRDGMAMNRDVAALLDQPITRRWMPSLGSIQLENLNQLRYLSDEMLRFVHSNGDWSKYRGGIGERLESIYERLEADLEVKRGR